MSINKFGFFKCPLSGALVILQLFMFKLSRGYTIVPDCSSTRPWGVFTSTKGQPNFAGNTSLRNSHYELSEIITNSFTL